MPTPAKVTPERAQQEIARARRQLRARNFSENGDIYRDFAEPLDTLAAYVEQQVAEDSNELMPLILKEGATLWRQIEDSRLVDHLLGVRLLKKRGEDGAYLYRCTFRELGAFEGTVGQCRELLSYAGGIMENRRNTELAEQRRAERQRQREQPEAEALPTPDPDSRA